MSFDQASWFSRYVTLTAVFSMVISGLSSYILKSIYENNVDHIWLTIGVLSIFIGFYIIVYFIINIRAVFDYFKKDLRVIPDRLFSIIKSAYPDVDNKDLIDLLRGSN